MEELESGRKYDLEERLLRYAKAVNEFVRALPKNVSNFENGRQLIRSAGSVGANYIEANDALGNKDRIMRLKISRKEAKESRFWLELLYPASEQETKRASLIGETNELLKILGTIIKKCSLF